MTGFSTRVTDDLARYVRLRRALGCAFTKQAAILRDFGRFVAQRPEARLLTQNLVLAYVLGCDVTPNERQRRYRVVKNFADYFAIVDPRTPSLDPHALPRCRAIPPVRILSHEELGRLLDAARTISPRAPIRGQTLHTIIGLPCRGGSDKGESVDFRPANASYHRFWAAVGAVWPETREQRCWVHRLANVLDKLPKRLQPKAKQALHAIMNAPTRAEAEAGIEGFAAEYDAKYPKAVASLRRDQAQLLTFYDFPAEDWRHLRTTNIIESPFATVRLRQRVTKGAGSRTKALMMAFKLLEMAEERWRK